MIKVQAVHAMAKNFKAARLVKIQSSSIFFISWVSKGAGTWIDVSITSLLVVENLAVALVGHTFYLVTFVHGVIQGTFQIQIPQFYALSSITVVNTKLLVIFWTHDGNDRKPVAKTSSILILETTIDPKLLSVWNSFKSGVWGVLLVIILIRVKIVKY